jgi:hypothetical protein
MTGPTRELRFMQGALPHGPSIPNFSLWNKNGHNCEPRIPYGAEAAAEFLPFRKYNRVVLDGT